MRDLDDKENLGYGCSRVQKVKQLQVDAKALDKATGMSDLGGVEVRSGVEIMKI